MADARKLYLVDAMSNIHRAYHAIQRLSTSPGKPTNAIYGFINRLRKMLRDHAPDYLAVAWDGPERTLRKDTYSEYKANRVPMASDLASQIGDIRRALDAYRIPILELAGYEADDVLGTLSRKAAAASYTVYVVSSDKDMMQLVNDSVCILNPPKDNLICDAAKVEEILVVPPERVVDVMALRGDAIDNIPGAPGIGDKGSVDLIQRFGSVEQALEHAAEVEKKSYRESLQNNRDNILYSKQLVTIDTDVAVELDVAAMKAGDPDVESLRE